ncbi:DMT family transporter [Sphaerochaeta pleomorpha]|nr:DMT family transporter [Sphaerochaeta pleomorpha]
MILIITSAVFFSLVGVGIRMAGDLPLMQKCFFRNIVALFFSYLLLKRNRISLSVDLFKPNFSLLLLRSILGTIGMFGNFYAVDHLLLGDASMLAKMSPFFVVVFSAFFLQEKVRLNQVLCIVGAFAGSLLIVKPSFSNLLFIPSLIGLVGGMGSGGAHTAVRALGKKGETGVVVVFFFSLFSTIITLPSTLLNFHPMTMAQLLWLLATGSLAACGQFALTAAYRYAPANKISVYDYSQVIFSALLGFVIFSQVPDLYSGFGYLVVIGMGFAMFLFTKKNQQEAGFPPSTMPSNEQ